MPKISNKKKKQIRDIINKNISLSSVHEFEKYSRYADEKLFVNSPDLWTDLERAICDYQARISMNIEKQINDLFDCANKK